LGVGWQDPAVIFESGLCVWKSGSRPRLELKRDGEMLRGCLALLWTGTTHDTPGVANCQRDYDQIAHAGSVARRAVIQEDVGLLGEAVRCSYQVQRHEGMDALPDMPGALAMKYCGGGWGGYAVYLFPAQPARDQFVAQSGGIAIEPYLRSCCDEER